MPGDQLDRLRRQKLQQAQIGFFANVLRTVLKAALEARERNWRLVVAPFGPSVAS